ncbi:MAG: UDP-N-acetylglucosamine 1-carboxyvinyltransferase [Christensenellaceae bacterium]|jgi:UDP-N-acetylglucosamine 1-carboxyvinyltransferase|nr:UDP-N-acetylglucosamine 1-carboxyvinyltransferase [Christensenellaceae bacterium]
MDKFVINGGNSLEGELDIPCSKNAYLPILAACMLHSGKIMLKKVPDFSDINKMIEILVTLGCRVQKTDQTLLIDCENATKYEIPGKLAGEIRSSIFLMGAILGKLKKAKVAYPGGCDIGARPIDLHLKGLRNLNIDITEHFGMIECDARNFKNDIVHLDFPSVGATENIMMASVLSKGTTYIFNAAKEPEIIDLAGFINSMGGKVYGAGTSTITIVGVEGLHDTEYTAIADRIIAGTHIIAVASCGGDVLLNYANFNHIYPLITKFKNSACKIVQTSDKIRIVSTGKLKSFGNIETSPYPGFPTDLQAQTMVLQTISRGTCVILENLFETRFKHVPELVKMGAKIIMRDRMAVVSGVDRLYGTEVTATDLRGGAALTIAGLVAKGQTVVSGVGHIDRGYEHLDRQFKKLGADIIRTSDT